MAQERIRGYIESHAIPINRIDPSADDYSDLEPIATAIGDARIVMLGEQDHGDAATFLAKTRLVEYLHEKKGFNVLAFESDFFAMNYGWDHTPRNKTAVDTFFRKNVLRLWAICDACQPLLYNYIPATCNTSRPLIPTGFDSQMPMQYSANRLVKVLDSALRSMQLPVTHDPSYASEMLPVIQSLVTKFWFLKARDSVFRKSKDYLQRIQDEARKVAPDSSFLVLLIQNLLQETELHPLSTALKSANIRDRQMAVNLEWLCNTRFPNEKIIVWAANRHVAKYSGTGGLSGKKITTMGYLFARNTDRQQDTYNIGFTSLRGSSGRQGEPLIEIKDSSPNSLEAWMGKKFNYSFVDLKELNKKFPHEHTAFKMRWAGYQEKSYDWNNVFNGIFFIKEMYPCKPIK